jgi:hypothetical protein
MSRSEAMLADELLTMDRELQNPAAAIRHEETRVEGRVNWGGVRAEWE